MCVCVSTSLCMYLLCMETLIFNPRTGKADTGSSLSSRPAFSAEKVPRQPGPDEESLSQTNKTKTKKRVITMQPWLTQNLLCSPCWAQTHIELPDSTSKMLESQVWATTLSVCMCEHAHVLYTKNEILPFAAVRMTRLSCYMKSDRHRKRSTTFFPLIRGMLHRKKSQPESRIWID